MKKRAFLCAALTYLIAHAPGALALTDKLTPPLISEALDFGAANSAKIESVLSDLYGCCGIEPVIIIRSKWSKLALLSGIRAQHGGTPAESDQSLILQDASLQIDITAYGHGTDFAREYKTRILQGGKTIEPVRLHADHFQKSKSPATSLYDWYAIIRTYFPYSALDLTKPFTIVLERPQGAKTYEIDPRRYK